MKKWWNARTTREQALIACGIAVIFALVLYQTVYWPASTYLSHARQARQDAMTNLTDVEAAARVIQASRATASTRQPLGDGGLRAAGTAAASEVGLAISRLQPLEQGGVEFWIDSAPAPQVYRWIEALHQKYGVTVVKADMLQVDGADNVRAQIALAAEPTP
jgi:type II secretory pathway component PulM